MSGYVALLRDPSVNRPFAASLVARLPIATAPLGLVLLVRDLRDSYPLAGLVTGVFAVGLAVGSPWWGRLMDRHGQPRVVVTTATTSALLLLLLTAATARPEVPAAVLPGIALLAGVAFPPLSPAMRATWRVVVTDPRERRRGYALDAAAVESIFVGGPVLLSLLLLLHVAVLPLVLTALLLAGGSIAYARTPGARTPVTAPQDAAPQDVAQDGDAARSGHRGALLRHGFLVMLVVMAAMSIGFGLLDVSLAGLAEERLGSADALGVLFAGIAGGSAIGGLLYGSHDWRSADRARLLVSLTGFGVMLAAVTLSVAAGLPLAALIAVLFVTGLFISPNLIAAQGLVDQLAPAHRLGEAQAWLSTAITAGAALGNALAGTLIAVGGPQLSFGAAAGAVLLAVVLALAAQRTWRSAAVRAGVGAGAP